MKNPPLSTLLLLFLLVNLTCKFEENIINIKLPQITIKASSEETKHFTRDNIKDELPEYILVAVVNHECYVNAPITEKIFIMEALWNRVKHNFNNNGATLHQQLLAPKQFTGLFIHRPKEFAINIKNNKYLISLARQIIYDNKRIYPEKIIYYWAGVEDGKHRIWVASKRFKTIIKTFNIFG